MEKKSQEEDFNAIVKTIEKDFYHTAQLYTSCQAFERFIYIFIRM